jgi:hypothetical protein
LKWGSANVQNSEPASVRDNDRRNLRRKLSLGLFALLLLVSIFAAASAWAEAESSGAGATGSAASLDMGVMDGNADAAQGLPHDDLTREAAAHLLTRSFDEPLSAPAEVFDDLGVQRFYSDSVALVQESDSGEGASAGMGQALLESNLPLRDENDAGQKRIVDLALVDAGNSGISSVNPLVDVTIPSELGDGITFADSKIEMSLEGAPSDRAASLLDDVAAFYPNVAEDSDFTVVPTPTGVETFIHLRTPAAPLTQVYNLGLPSGGILRSTGEGGAEVVTEGTVSLGVRPPTAIDANGDEVPVTLEVDGHSIVVTSAPKPDVAYPILVDPIVDSYWSHETGPTSLPVGWNAVANPGFSAVYTGPGGATGPYNTGFNLYSHSSTPWVEAGWDGRFFLRVPRYSSDTAATGIPPTSFYTSANFWDINYFMQENNYSPVARTGIKLMNGQWTAVSARNGQQGQMMYASSEHTNPNQNVEAKEVAIELNADYAQRLPDRRFYVGVEMTQATDLDNPSFGFAKTPKWLNGSVHSDPARTIDFSVSDPGMGMWRVKAKTPKAQGGYSEPVMEHTCLGSQASPCPRTWEAGFTNYDPFDMPQGENSVRLFGRDIVGHESERLAKVNVDRTPPQLGLSGNLTEQGSVGTRLGSYTLNYSAADGDEAAAAAQTPFGVAGTGMGQLQRPMGIAVDSSGNVFVVDRLNNRVAKYDAKGNFLSQFGSTGSGDGQFNDPRGIAITAAGNIWVSEFGNKRLQQFNAKGEFLRKFTYGGGGGAGGGQGAEFVEPYSVAAGPNETLWVTDIGSDRIYRFKEDGTFLGVAKGMPVTMNSPLDVEVDRFGNAWVVEPETDKIYQFDSSGNYRFSFGATGTGDGQMEDPWGIAIADSGNIAVVDPQLGRVQVFAPDGRFLRKFGALGTGATQLNEPRGIDYGPDNSMVIADAGGPHVDRWIHADQDPQSGTAKVEIKVDGTGAKTESQGCATKNCTIAGSWTLNADNYTVGPHKVEVTATDAAGLATTKTLNIETHGDRLAPAITLSGSMTEQATLGTTRPSYKLKVTATDPGSVEERQSGVALLITKVDGAAVDSMSQACAAGGCAINREWTLSSIDYAVGTHTVKVEAMDAAGRSSVKSLQINITRDTTAPVFASLDPFYTAPQGWVEQRIYGVLANVTDAGGYGVTSVQLKIDGAVVRSVSQACAAGGCSTALGVKQPLDTTAYDGGAHPAELIATDGAGNTRKRTWAMNVVPKGQVLPAEATDTMEAYEETAQAATELTPVDGLVTETIGDEGLNPQLYAQAGELQSDGAPASSSISLDPEDGFTLETAGLSEQDSLHQADIEIHPAKVGAGASEPELTDGSAAVISNSAAEADTILRPAYNGLMSFQAIRGTSASKEYSWQMMLNWDETLKLLDPEHAAVVWSDGTQAMLITATEAHGADGKKVATSLSVSGGNVLTLTVHHQASGVVYPVVAGVGWQGGYQLQESDFRVPPPPEESASEIYSDGVMGAPVPYLMEAGDREGEASSSSVTYKYLQTFRFRQCSLDGAPIYSCGDWEQAMKGFFWYNYHKAWYQSARDPRCPNSGTVGVTLDYHVCEWVGKKWAWYETPGDHITAQVLYKINYVLKGTVVDDRHMTVFAWPSGHAKEHDTDCICNPST